MNPLPGDGLRGTDEVEGSVPKGEYYKTVLVGRAVMDVEGIDENGQG